MYPMEIRATLISNVVVVAALSEALVTVIYNLGFQKLGSNAPFFICGFIDFVIVIMLVLLARCGLIPTLEKLKGDGVKVESSKAIEHSEDADSKFQRV